jgi:hypothetical protein
MQLSQSLGHCIRCYVIIGLLVDLRPPVRCGVFFAPIGNKPLDRLLTGCEWVLKGSIYVLACVIAQRAGAAYVGPLTASASSASEVHAPPLSVSKGLAFSMKVISGFSARDWRYCSSTRSDPITTAPARQIIIASSALISLLSSAFTVLAIFSLSFSIVFILI